MIHRNKLQTTTYKQINSNDRIIVHHIKNILHGEEYIKG